MPLLSNVSRWLTGRAPTNDDARVEEQEASPRETGRVLRRPEHTAEFVVERQARESTPHPDGPSTQETQELLYQALEPLREQLLEHRLYDAVSTLPRLRTFMGVHVYAVWDFMCLAKRLQRDFTSLGTLWLPPRNPALARFINGVIHGEESDLDPDGGVASHLQLYIAAMDEVGANAEPIRRFLSLLEYGADPELALAAVDAPLCARVFVSNTLTTVARASTVEVLASFLYGREDLIPAMFQRLLPRWRESRGARHFAYYVERHIELDGDDHGPAAQRALSALCGDDLAAWTSAYQAAKHALRARIELWDAVLAELE